jgi:hypothetical protein
MAFLKVKDENGNWILVESPQSNPVEHFSSGETITVENNKSYIANDAISELTLVYPTDDFICHLSFTLASEGTITITLPESKYIGEVPTFANGETWELSIRNGVVVGGKAE